MSDDIGLDDQERDQLVDLLHTDAAHDHPAAEQAIRRMLAGQAVAMSAEDRAVIKAADAWLYDPCKGLGSHRENELAGAVRARRDRLLSTPGQDAKPAAGEVAVAEHSESTEANHHDPREAAILALQNGTTLAEVAAALIDADRESRSIAQSVEHPALTVDPALCRRLASEAQNRCRASMEPGGPVSWSGDKLNSVARQLTAAADLRDAFDALQVVAKDAQDQLIEEREAARRESARLAEAFEEATGKLAVAVTAKENAEHELDAARAECERLRKDWSMYNDYQFRSEYERLKHADVAQGKRIAEMLTSIRALLATEPAVSEERCGEIAQMHWATALTMKDVVAAARQLHALRAGLQEIVGGEARPAADIRPAVRALLDSDMPAGDLRKALAELIGDA